MFQASGTVIAGNPVTRDHGARIDFEKNQPGAALSIARVEMVAITPVQVALEAKLLLNRQNATANLACSSLGVPDSMCNYFVYLHDGSQVSWAAPVAPLSGRPVSTRDTSLVDSDGDGIADQQDACPITPAGVTVNARGCGINQ